jgi:hypothetical protein
MAEVVSMQVAHNVNKCIFTMVALDGYFHGGASASTV